MAGSYKKVLRIKFYGICSKCFARVEFNNELIKKREEISGTIPFSAKSASGVIWCPICGSAEITTHYEYANLYRKRCTICGEMFEDDKTWNFEHESCLENKMKRINRILEIVSKPKKKKKSGANEEKMQKITVDEEEM